MHSSKILVLICAAAFFAACEGRVGRNRRAYIPPAQAAKATATKNPQPLPPKPITTAEQEKCGSQNPFCEETSQSNGKVDPPPKQILSPPPPFPPKPVVPTTADCGTQNPFCNSNQNPPAPKQPAGSQNPFASSNECGSQNPFCDEES